MRQYYFGEKMAGKLTLIPTPIDEQSPLESIAKEILLNAIEKGDSLFIVEELKACRRRWVRFGLPREVINDFVPLNEHNTSKMTGEIIQKLKQGLDAYIMSDGGLPAFMDPGMELVRACHENNIVVTSTPFCNSISLALALSGIDHRRFSFEGFLPRKSDERKEIIKLIDKKKQTIVLMDTPYRLKSTLEDLKDIKRNIFLAMDLNSEKEELLFGNIIKIIEIALIREKRLLREAI